MNLRNITYINYILNDIKAIVTLLCFNIHRYKYLNNYMYHRFEN